MDISVTGCFVEHGGKLLYLHRQPEKSQGDMWGLPAGKQENEELDATMIREIREETGIQLKAEDLEYLNMVYATYPEFNVVFHMYRAIVNEEPQVTLSHEEHQDYDWYTPEEATKIQLMDDMLECMQMHYTC